LAELEAEVERLLAANAAQESTFQSQLRAACVHCVKIKLISSSSAAAQKASTLQVVCTRASITVTLPGSFPSPRRADARGGGRGGDCGGGREGQGQGKT
jgi:hypothetical protein